MDSRDEVVEVLRCVFESSTALVLTRPSMKTRENGVQMARDMPLDDLVSETGALAGRSLATALEAAGLRPADFVFSAEAARSLGERLGDALRGDGSVAFLTSFREALGIRG